MNVFESQKVMPGVVNDAQPYNLNSNSVKN